MLSGIASAALGGIAALGSSALSQWLGRENAEHAADYGADVSRDLAAWKAKNLPKLERQGLEAAGINPLLAYGSIGSGSMPILSVDSSYTPRFDGIADALTHLPENASARALKSEQIESLRADRSKVEAEEDLLRAQAQEVRSRIPKNEETAGQIKDERNGVIKYKGIRIPISVVVERLSQLGSVLGGSSERRSAPTVPPPVRSPAPEKKDSLLKRRADASWIPAGGSSARDMLKKRMKQF